MFFRARVQHADHSATEPPTDVNIVLFAETFLSVLVDVSHFFSCDVLTKLQIPLRLPSDLHLQIRLLDFEKSRSRTALIRYRVGAEGFRGLKENFV